MAGAVRATLGEVDQDAFEDLLDEVEGVAPLLMRRRVSADPTVTGLAEAAGRGEVAAIRAAWVGLDPDVRARLARLDPWLVGGLDGADFFGRTVANRTAVHAANAGLEPRRRPDGTLPSEVQEWADLYRRLLCEPTYLWVNGRRMEIKGHQVVLFDPDGGPGPGGALRYAELVGDVDGATDIVVMVSGAHASTASMIDHRYENAAGRVADSNGGTAVVVWMGGESLPESSDGSVPASDGAMGPRLRDFAAGLDNPNGVRVAFGRS